MGRHSLPRALINLLLKLIILRYVSRLVSRQVTCRFIPGTLIIGSDKSTLDLIGQLEIIRDIIGRRMLRDGLRLKYDGHKYDL